MPGSATAVFSKLDDFEAALQTEGSLKLFITARGQLEARLTQVQLYRVRLVAIEETLPIVGYLAVPSHQTLVLFPIADQPSPVWGAVGVRRGEILTLGSSHRVHFRSQGPCAWGSIAFRELDLATCYRDLTEDTLTIPPGVHLWRPRQAHGRRLLQLHSAAIRAASAGPKQS